ncbi:histidine--tRNA ligase [Spiroplasma culicicola]|uniref:Histidine--tRNA ligase n=1 Tax=Spiroplasma culicicola AES-1 TaxID=1276246 RepID=W6A776_9MOLU|nr:histidine--tRNA ligase [Spiroplasma culicicola]AHI52831.1 histidyl-tRNA synthetase [Spiroplasma culicicola AES-1]
MIQKPRGTVDLYDKKVKEFFALEMIIRNIVDLYNYSEIKTPIFESTDLFLRGVGSETDIVSKEMYTFNDKKNRSLTLKPEGTAPTVRAILENKMYINENLPLKLFYFSNMFRYERPQNGRQRQFTQFGVEVFGPKNALIDSEVLCLAVNILNAIGIENYSVHLNYLATGENRQKYIADLKIQLSTLQLCDDCQTRINTNPLRVLDCKVDSAKFSDIKDMKEYLSQEDQTQYSHLKTTLDNLAIKYQEDKLLVRGLDYYTGYVFEIKDKNGSTLLGGGRFDNLVNELGQVDLPAAGFGMGIERIVLALEEANISLSEQTTLDAYIIGLSDKAKQFSNILLLMLRSAGLKVDFDYMNRSMKSAFKQSEKLNAQNIIIIGDNELKENVVVIKNQITKTEQKVNFDQIVETIMKGK